MPYLYVLYSSEMPFDSSSNRRIRNCWKQTAAGGSWRCVFHATPTARLQIGNETGM